MNEVGPPIDQLGDAELNGWEAREPAENGTGTDAAEREDPYLDAPTVSRGRCDGAST